VNLSRVIFSFQPAHEYDPKLIGDEWISINAARDLTNFSLSVSDAACK